MKFPHAQSEISTSKKEKTHNHRLDTRKILLPMLPFSYSKIPTSNIDKTVSVTILYKKNKIQDT